MCLIAGLMGASSYATIYTSIYYVPMPLIRIHNPAQVPRLHAIIVEPEEQQEPGKAWSAAHGKSLREAILGFLISVCGGDSLAAEYLLLQLISR